MTERELAVQVYLAKREPELGQYFLSVMQARQCNKQLLIQLRQPITAEIFKMTPEEELFASFFNSEKAFVKDMTILELRAHREDMRKIAFEARARLTAIDDEDRGRKAKRGEVTGFKQNLQSDDVSSEAIGRVKERTKRMSKEEKLIENMMKLPGMDRKTAEMMISAGTIKATLDNKFGKSEKDDIEENKPLTKVNNPFAAKPVQLTETETQTSPEPVQVSIQEETNTVVITKTEEVEVKENKFVNPFAKG